jgi:hypothetical protein
MKRIEKVRKPQAGEFDVNQAMEMVREGWRLSAVEWEREVDAPGALPTETPSAGQFEELPYGLRVAQDCHHVEQDPQEMEALHTLTELIVQDATLTRMADELNRRGFKPREATKWTALMIYNLFPRLIEVTPRIFSEDQWKIRRPQVAAMSWNS